jgi:hypothetical protein
MKPQAKSYNLYHNLGYWFLLFIVLVIAGFYHTYFSVLFEPKLPAIHVHFALMSLWVAMLITQPFLIKYKKRGLHRTIGKVSYVVVPLVILSGVVMMRVGYFASIERLAQESANGIQKYTASEINHLAARSMALPVFYLLWMALFYILAIINRKNSAVHARYMLATALTLLGPTVDRAIFFILKIETLAFNIPIETFAFLMIDLILITLLLYDRFQKRKALTLMICVGIYLMSQALYFVVMDTRWWENLITALM